MSQVTAKQLPGEPPVHLVRKGGSLGATVALFAAGNSVSTVMRGVAVLLAARLVEPDALGLFNAIALVLGYLPIIGLGAFEGLNRELPYFYGRNEPAKAKSLAAVAQGWAALLGTVVALACFGVALWQALGARWENAAGWLTTSVSAFLLFFATNYLQVLYRTSHDFRLLSKIAVCGAVASLGLVAAVAYLDYFGLCLRALGILTLEGLLLWWWRPVRVAPRLQLGELRGLIVVGGPILFADQLVKLWFVLHHTLIWHFLGNRGLGLYFFPLLHPALCALPVAVQQITYPRITEMYARNGSICDLVRYLRRPIVYVTLVMSAGVAVTWMIFPAVIEFLLPKYVEGVPAVRWALFDAIIFGLLPMRNVFSTARKQHYHVLAIGGGIAGYIVALACLMQAGLSLEIFPQAFLIGRVLYVMLAYLFIHILCQKDRNGSALRGDEDDLSAGPWE